MYVRATPRSESQRSHDDLPITKGLVYQIKTWCMKIYISGLYMLS